MRGDVTVYSPKNVLCTMGIHIASGFTEDGFITITPQGDGVTDEAGADGEVVISIPLSKGTATLSLQAKTIRNEEAMNFWMLVLKRVK